MEKVRAGDFEIIDFDVAERHDSGFVEFSGEAERLSDGKRFLVAWHGFEVDEYDDATILNIVQEL